VVPLPKPKGKKELDFYYAQVVARKDVAKSFEILQAQFVIGRGLTRFWDQKIL
jgi:hypothetical protein